MTRLGLTPSQTVGPFFAHALDLTDGQYVVPDGTEGSFWLYGTVFDGDGELVPDAMVESWQADPDGRFNHPDDPRGAGPTFRGFARALTDQHGQWSILTVRPGRVPDHDGRSQAPHIELSVFARGLLDRVVTRVYLPDEANANAEDPVLATVPLERRTTLVAEPDGDKLRFDIRLQGDGETVFFSV
jgi:protocatechuate 3,4-dioxygenase, alpha subunit